MGLLSLSVGSFQVKVTMGAINESWDRPGVGKGRAYSHLNCLSASPLTVDCGISSLISGSPAITIFFQYLTCLRTLTEAKLYLPDTYMNPIILLIAY
jgi:hypothetical protein